jgi:hypothetical protein
MPVIAAAARVITRCRTGSGRVGSGCSSASSSPAVASRSTRSSGMVSSVALVSPKITLIMS